MAQDLDVLLLLVRFCDLGPMGTSNVVQKEAFAASGHWTLVMHGLDDLKNNCGDVVCGGQCGFLRQKFRRQQDHLSVEKVAFCSKSLTKHHRSGSIFARPHLIGPLFRDA